MVLPQYLDERVATEQPVQVGQRDLVNQAGQTVQTGQAGQAGQASPKYGGVQSAAAGTSLDNRIGVGASAADTVNPLDLPVDAHGDVDLINRIKTWPREKQPFWYLNWQAIQAHRGDVNNAVQPSQTQANPKSFFAG